MLGDLSELVMTVRQGSGKGSQMLAVWLDTIAGLSWQAGGSWLCAYCFVAWTALATFPVVICVMIAHSEVTESLEGQPE